MWDCTECIIVNSSVNIASHSRKAPAMNPEKMITVWLITDLMFNNYDIKYGINMQCNTSIKDVNSVRCVGVSLMLGNVTLMTVLWKAI